MRARVLQAVMSVVLATAFLLIGCGSGDATQEVRATRATPPPRPSSSGHVPQTTPPENRQVHPEGPRTLPEILTATPPPPESQSSEDATARGTVAVNVTVSSGNAGQVVALLCHGSFGFSTDSATRTKTATIVEGMSTLEFEDVPHGSYAVAVFHDKNSNSHLDRAFGRTTERTGASNNPPLHNGRLFNTGPMGPKPWFELDSRSITLDIRL